MLALCSSNDKSNYDTYLKERSFLLEKNGESMARDMMIDGSVFTSWIGPMFTEKWDDKGLTVSSDDGTRKG